MLRIAASIARAAGVRGTLRRKNHRAEGGQPCSLRSSGYSAAGTVALWRQRRRRRAAEQRRQQAEADVEEARVRDGRGRCAVDGGARCEGCCRAGGRGGAGTGGEAEQAAEARVLAAQQERDQAVTGARRAAKAVSRARTAGQEPGGAPSELARARQAAEWSWSRTGTARTGRWPGSARTRRGNKPSASGVGSRASGSEGHARRPAARAEHAEIELERSGWVAQALVSPGRADPTWAVPESTAEMLLDRWAELPPRSDPPPDLPPLGYRGCRRSQVAFMGGAWTAVRRIVVQQKCCSPCVGRWFQSSRGLIPLLGFDPARGKARAAVIASMSPLPRSVSCSAEPVLMTVLSSVLLTAMTGLARDAGLNHLIAPVCPSQKDPYPTIPVGRYARWTARRVALRPLGPSAHPHGRPP